jgi:hypothetical protein
MTIQVYVLRELTVLLSSRIVPPETGGFSVLRLYVSYLRCKKQRADSLRLLVFHHRLGLFSNTEHYLLE